MEGLKLQALFLSKFRNRNHEFDDSSSLYPTRFILRFSCNLINNFLAYQEEI